MAITLSEEIKESKVAVNPPVFINHVHNRIKRNQNLICVVNGDTGSGKSYACLRLAVDLSERMNTNFSIENNLSFSFERILEKMQYEINQKPGTVFILEEIGAFGSGGSSREWQSKANKFFNSFLQTSRHRNQIFILNCPAFTFLEASSRILVHFRLEAKGIDFKNKVSVFKPKRLQHNCASGKVYAKYLRYVSNNVKIAYKQIKFTLPPEDIVKEYEAEKRIFTDSLNKKILEKKTSIKENQLTDLRKKMAYKFKKEGMTQTQISKELGLTESAISLYFKNKKTGENPAYA